MAAVRTLDEQEVSLQIPVPPAASSSVITTAGRQPIRAEIVHAAKLAADAEENARERQHPKGKYTARERLDLL
ncbi:MAG: methylmalonyl-CoA carboxyltransferase, partial [Scardovia wiggsiae]